MSKRIGFLFVVSMLLATAPGQNVTADPLAEAGSPPVRIIGDDALDAAAAAGVFSGSGTEDDPYVLEGRTFDARTTAYQSVDPRTANVVLERTTRHIVIRSNDFGTAPVDFFGHPYHGSHPAIAVLSSRNVTIDGNDFVNIRSSAGLIVVDDSPAFPGTGRPTAHVAIVNNTFSGHDGTAVAARGAEVRIEGNRFEGFVGTATVVETSGGDVHIEGNTFTGFVGTATAVHTSGGEVHIVGNTIHGSSHYALVVRAPRGGLSIQSNVIDGGSQGRTGIVTILGPHGATLAIGSNVITGYDTGIWIGETYGGGSGHVDLVDNVIHGGSSCVRLGWASATGTLSGNLFESCGHLQVPRSVIVDRTNRYNGGATYQLRNLANTVVDATAEPAGWLDVVGHLDNVTLRGFHGTVMASDIMVRGTNLTIESSSFLGIGGVGLRLILQGPASALRNVSVVPPSSALFGIHVRSYGDVGFDNVSAQGGDRGAAIQLVQLSGSIVMRDTTARGGHMNLRMSGAVVDVSIEGGAFLDGGTGIDVRAWGDPSLSSVTVRNATISGNADHGIRTYETLVDARLNWWGDASGPAAEDNPDGDGDPVTGPVLVEPWLTSPP